MIIHHYVLCYVSTWVMDQVSESGFWVRKTIWSKVANFFLSFLMNFQSGVHRILKCLNISKMGKKWRKTYLTCIQLIIQGNSKPETQLFWKPGLSLFSTLHTYYYARWWPRCLIFRWHDTQMSERLLHR